MNSLSKTHVCLGATPGVPGAIKEPVVWSRIPATNPAMTDARLLRLQIRPASPAALSLVRSLAALVATWEARSRNRQRGPGGLEKLSAAVGSIVGGLLMNWGGSEARLSYRVRSKDDFDRGALVSYDNYCVAMDGLIALGLVGLVATGKRFSRDFGGGMVTPGGHAPRYRPVQSLLEAATEAGVVPATVGADWQPVPSRVPPRVSEPVIVKALKVYGQRDSLKLPAARLGNALGALQASVEAANAFAAEHDVRGCLPPRWSRHWFECPELYGRWHAAGHEGAYQSMRPGDRLGITIDGAAVVEVDVSAAHLTIMLGLLGKTVAAADPYAVISQIPRSVLKHWVLVTLGKGLPPKAWSAKDLHECPETADYPIAAVAHALTTAYPFLSAPAAAVLTQAGLDALSHLGAPQRLLTHRLMAIEATAISDAIVALRSKGVLALPIHDSLLVPLAARGATMAAMGAAFVRHAGIVPTLKIAPPTL